MSPEAQEFECLFPSGGTVWGCYITCRGQSFARGSMSLGWALRVHRLISLPVFSLCFLLLELALPVATMPPGPSLRLDGGQERVTPRKKSCFLILFLGDPAGQAEEGPKGHEGPHRASLVNNARLPVLVAAGSMSK